MINKYISWLGAVTMLFSIVACKTQKAAEKYVYTPDKVIPTEKALFWKISGYGLKKPSYLYGTIHMIPRNEFSVPVPVDKALADSKKITFEIDMNDMFSLSAQFSILTKALMKDGKTLKDLLSPEDYQIVRAKMAEKNIPAGMFERVKPMFLSMILSNDVDMSGGGSTTESSDITSVEMELYELSKNYDVSSDGLETVGYQMSIFDQIPYDVQAKMLVEALRSTEKKETGESELDKLVALYKAQDIQAMQSMIDDDAEGFGQYEDVILSKRNQNWIPIMTRMMRENPTFFAVGAGHLGGEQGVIALLRKTGFQVEVAGN